MILETAVFLSGLGVAAWAIGWVFNAPEIGMLGCVFILGTGAMITGQGLEYQTGQTVIENTTYDNDLIENTSVTNASSTERTVTNRYSSLNTPTRFALGPLIMILGGVGILRSLNRLN